jgi:O-antigen ligase
MSESLESNVLPFKPARVLANSDSRLSAFIAISSVVAIVFSALAFGSVEAWAMAVLESVAVMLLGLWIMKSIIARQIRIAIPRVLLPVAGLVLCGLIQSVTITGGSGDRKSISMDVEASRVAVTSIFFMLVLALTGANFIRDKRRLGRLATFLVFYGLALAVFALIQNFAWDGAFYWFRPTRAAGFGPFANRDHFAGYLEMLAPFPAALVATGAIRRDQKLAYGFAAVMMVIAAFAALSRGGMLSLTVEAVFIATWAYRSKSRARARDTAGATRHLMRGFVRAALLIGVLGAIAALGIAWIGADPMINKAAQTLTDINQDASNPISRQGIWSDTWAMIEAHSVTGVGLGAYETVYPIYSHNNGRLIVAQSHNDYLQVIADCGLVGAVLLVVFLVALYVAMRRALDVEDHFLSGVAVACSAGLIGILVHSLFDFNLQIPSNALLFLFLAVMLSNVPAAAPRRSRVEARRQVDREAPVLVLAGV